ncbi:MAG: hypothetical protein QF722_06395 [Candidatus Thalassarchaeaceae archaeon]|nr:hypothetical protein [Candidatus Thalassarchaeaceae archaeon]
MEPSWQVLLCRACERAFGKPRNAKGLQCPHCNHLEAKVLSRHFSANEASSAVSAANVPPEIRDQLSSWLNDQDNIQSMANSEPLDGHSILSKAADENGIVTIESLENVLVGMNPKLNAESFAEQACAEGELLQDGPNRWKRA